MTDCVAALGALTNMDHPLREECFDRFYEYWKGEQLVINKWLALQASSSRPDTVDNVRALCEHPGFSISNPNSVYSLFITLGTMTPVRFHDSNGAGYDLLTEMVIKLDRANPMLAARIVDPLTHWRRHRKDRAQLMKNCLTRIATQDQLSSNLEECVRKSLA